MVSLCIAWALVARIVPSPLAVPNERSLHRQPVPRIGGIAILGGWMSAWPLAPFSWRWAAPFALVALISLLDDWRNVPAAFRLAVHGACAVAAAIFLLSPYNLLLLLVDAMIIAWMANLYNFMDGADGLAAAMGIAGFAAFALCALLFQRADSAVLYGALAIACAGFLAFNLPPARLFMGDVGAVSLGFLAAVFGLDGIAEGVWRWWFPPLVFLPFILDATLTLVRRGTRGANVARAHREHYYQRAILIDGGHRPTLLVYAAWMVACAGLALGAMSWAPETGPVLLIGAAGAFGLYCRAIDRRWAGRTDLHHAG